jgi:hypothetical protein
MSDRNTPIETDPLGAIRAELVGAARRRTAARRRRQRATTVVATGLMMLVSVTGASALIGGTTGVQVVDTLLDRIDMSQREGGQQGPPGSPAIPADLASASAPIEVPWGDGTKAIGVAYVSKGGPICFALAKPHGEGVSEARGGVRGCISRPALTRRLADDNVYVTGVSLDETVVVRGYAAGDVEAIDVTGPSGKLGVRLGEPWEPDPSGGEVLRPFVAYASVGSGAAAQRDVDPRDYEIVARMEDGRISEVRP